MCLYVQKDFIRTHSSPHSCSLEWGDRGGSFTTRSHQIFSQFNQPLFADLLHEFQAA